MLEYINRIKNKLDKDIELYSVDSKTVFELLLCLYLIDLGVEGKDISAIEIGKIKLEEIHKLHPEKYIEDTSYLFNMGNAYMGITKLILTKKDVKFFDKEVFDNYLEAKHNYLQGTQGSFGVISIHDAKLLRNYAFTLLIANRFLEAIETIITVLLE